jgi:hypothetical protein
MKKGKLLIILLCVSTTCINVAVATTVQPKKPVHKNVTDSHKKNKAALEHKITEKDIAECTSLINKVSQKEMTEIPVVMPLAATPNNTKIAEHLQAPADVQLFASDDPKAIAHLTGKTVLPPVTPVLKSATPSIPVKSTKSTTELTASRSITKPVLKITAPVPDHVNKAAKPITASVNTPKATAAPPTIKTTLNPEHPTTKAIEKAPAATVVKPIAIKAAPLPSQPKIELLAPTTSPDLDHLEGKSANLENLQPSVPEAPTKLSAAEHQKNKKLVDKKKISSSSIPRAKAKKGSS